MTPREFARERRAAEQRLREDLAQDVAHAWYVANFGVAAYVGKLPDLKQVLLKLGISAKPSRKHVGQRAKLLAEEIGVPLKPISEAAKKALLKLHKRNERG